MRFRITCSDRVKTRLGHIAVGGLLALVYWVSYGCGEPRSRDDRTEATGQVVEHTPVTPAAHTPVISPDTPPPVVPREVTFAEAETAYREQRYEEAVNRFTSYTERKSENAWGHYMLGLSAWKSGQYDLAEGAFEKALELDPEHVKSLINLSRVFLETNRPEDAIERIQEVLLIDGESSDAFRLLGRARHQLGLVEEAIDAYWEAIVLNAQDAWSMNNLGFLLIQEGRFEEALPPLARAIELREDVSVFHNNLGMALERTGHYTAAAQEYGAAVDRGSEKASVNLARVENRQDDSSVGTIDLTTLALQFVDEIERFRQPVTAEVELPDSVRVPDPEPDFWPQQ